MSKAKLFGYGFLYFDGNVYGIFLCEMDNYMGVLLENVRYDEQRTVLRTTRLTRSL